MGIGFYLTGRYRGETAADEWLESVRAWIEAHAGTPLEAVGIGTTFEGEPAAIARLHPAAEAVEIAVPVPGRVIASGKTSTVGPGYHIYACDLLRRLGGVLGVAWDEPDEEAGTGDETGYFHGGGGDAVEREFLKWLRANAETAAEYAARDYEDLMISMPIGRRYPGRGAVVTPMGPRDLDWLRSVAEDPSRGLDLFPWWEAGLGADFHRGRALCRMWQDVPWRAPLVESEARTLLDTHLDLARAYALNPDLPYPWREWRELIGLVEDHFGYVEALADHSRASIERHAFEVAGGPLVGYRRGPVTIDLAGGWSIAIDGAMVDEWDDDGAWNARDGRRTVWFSAYRRTGQDGVHATVDEILAEQSLPEGERLDHRDGPVASVATFGPHEEDGETLWRLAAVSAVDGALAVCNVFVPKINDREWAIATWRSLKHPGPADEDEEDVPPSTTQPS